MLSILFCATSVSSGDAPNLITPCSHTFSGSTKYLEWDDSGSGAFITKEFELPGSITYDLTHLQLLENHAMGSAGYTIKDENRNSYNRDFNYVFNICGDILSFNALDNLDTENIGTLTNYSVGQKCRHDGVAEKDRDGCPVDANGDVLCDGLGLGPAFQYQLSSEYRPTQCFRLGRSDTKDSPYACGDSGVRRDCMNWLLINKDDPTAGVILEYDGGDICGEKPRKLRLYFECDPNDVDGNIPDEELISEREMCTYDMHISSRYGCPSNCPIQDGYLCSGNGWCGYDRTALVARCYCDQLYEGTACENLKKKSGGMTTTEVALVVVVGLFFSVFALLAFILFKIRQLKGNDLTTFKPLNPIDLE